MAKTRYINIDFPFRDSSDGSYFKMNKTDKDAIRADLLHLLLTNKGERFMLPEFGTNLIKYIFEPKDSKTITDLKLEISEAINKFIPNLQLNDIIIEDSVLSEYMVTIKIDYTATDGLYSQPDTLIINM